MANLTMSSAVVSCVWAAVTDAASFVLRLFQTLFVCDVSRSGRRLDDVELALGRVLGAMRCVVVRDEDEDESGFRCCEGLRCGWPGAGSVPPPV